MPYGQLYIAFSTLITKPPQAKMASRSWLLPSAALLLLAPAARGSSTPQCRGLFDELTGAEVGGSWRKGWWLEDVAGGVRMSPTESHFLGVPDAQENALVELLSTSREDVLYRVAGPNTVSDDDARDGQSAVVWEGDHAVLCCATFLNIDPSCTATGDASDEEAAACGAVTALDNNDACGDAPNCAYSADGTVRGRYVFAFHSNGADGRVFDGDPQTARDEGWAIECDESGAVTSV